MAILYQSTGGIGAGGDAAIAIPYPSRVDEDDILIAALLDADDDTFDTPNGWHQLSFDNSTTSLSTAFYWKRADGTETGNATFTSATNSGNLIAGIIYRFSGCVKQGNPVEGYSTVGIANWGAVSHRPEVDPSGLDRLAVAIAVIEDDTVSPGIYWDLESNLTTTVGSDGQFILKTTTLTGTNKPGSNANISFDGGAEYADMAAFYLIPDPSISITLNTASGTEFTDVEDPVLEFTPYPYEIEIIDSIKSGSENLTATVGQLATHYTGQSFTGDGSTISGVRFFIAKGTTISGGSWQARLYAHTGTYGTSSDITGTPLRTSATFTPADIATTNPNFAWYEFEFYADYLLVNGTKYCVVIYTVTQPTAGGLQYQGYTTQPHSGMLVDEQGGNSSYDMTFAVYKKLANNFEIEIEVEIDNVNTFDGGGISPIELDGSKLWYAVAVNSSSNDVYATIYNDDVYRQKRGEGAFEPLSSGVGGAMKSIAVNSRTGDVIVSKESVGIYKQAFGRGSFTAIDTGTNLYRGIAIDESNNDVYVCNSNDIYKQTGGVGTFAAMNQTSRQYHDVAVDKFGNIYAVVGFGDIYKDTGSGMTALSQTSRSYSSITIDTNTNDVYVTVEGGDIYKQTGGSGNFTAIGESSRSWFSSSFNITTNELYTLVYGDGDTDDGIYKTSPLHKYSSKTARKFVNTVTSTDYPPFNDNEKLSLTLSKSSPSRAAFNTETQTSSQGVYGSSSHSIGESFTGDGNQIAYVQMQLSKFGSPTGNGVIKIYAHTGTYGSGGLPTGTALATSESIDVSTITTTETWYSFRFPSDYTLVKDTNYFAIFEFSGGDASNYIKVHIDSANSGNAYDGNIAYWNSTVWSATTTSDVVFILGTDINANLVLIDEYPSSNRNTFYSLGGYELAAPPYPAAGQTFKGGGGLLKKCTFFLFRNATIGGNCYAKLYAHTGTFGTSGKPTGTALATSDAVDASTISATDYEDVEFTFSNPYKTTLDTPYCIVLEYTYDNGVTNVLRLGLDSTTPTHEGNNIIYNSTWLSSSNTDACFSVYEEFPLLPIDTYYYQVRAKDPTGIDAWTDWIGTELTATFDVVENLALFSSINTATTTTGVLIGNAVLESAINTNSTTSGVLKNQPTLIQGRSDSQWRITQNLGYNSSPIRNGLTEKIGQTLNSFSGKIKKIGIYYVKAGSPVYDLTAKIYSTTSGFPNAVLQTSSTTISSSSLGANGFMYFDFDGTEYTQDIAFTVELTNWTSDSATDEVRVLRTLTKEFDGNYVYFNQTEIWQGITDNTFRFDLINEGATSGELFGKTFATSTVNTATTTTSVLTADGLLETAINTATTTTSLLKGSGSLVSTINTATTTSSDLTNKPVDPIFGQIDGVASINAVLTANGSLIGVSNPALTISGEIQARGDLAVQVDGVAITNGLLISIVAIDSSISTATTTSSILTGTANLVSAINGAATNEGILTNSALAGTINSATTTSSVLTANGALASVVTISITTDSTLIGKVFAEGASNGATTIDATGVLKNIISGSVDPTITTSGTLTGTGELSDIETSTATTDGILTATGALLGAITISITNSGTMIRKARATVQVNGSTSLVAGIQAIGGGGGAPSYFSKGTLAATGGTLSIDVSYPTTVNENDIIFAVLMDADNDGFSAPDGTWNIILVDDTNAQAGITIMWKRAAGTESGTQTFTGTASQGKTTAGIMYSYSGCITTGTPFEGLVQHIMEQTTTHVMNNTNNTTGDNRLAVTLVGAEADTLQNWAGSGWTTDDLQTDATGDGSSFGAISKVLSTSGTNSGPLQWSFSSNTWSGGVALYLLPQEGGILFVGVISGQATTSGVLTGIQTVNISSTSNGVATVAGVLTSTLNASSSIDGTTTTNSILTATGALLGASNGATTTVSDLTGDTGTTAIIGQIDSVTTTASILTAKGLLESTINTATTTDSILTADGSLIATINGTTTLAGVLIATGTLTGTSTNVATTSGLLNSNLQGSVIVDTTTTTQAVLTASGALLGTSTTATTITASLTSTLSAESSINGQTTTSSVLSATGSLSHTSTSTTTTQGILSAEGTLAGTITTATTTSSELIAKGALTGSADGSCLNISLVSGLAELNASITTQTTTSGELQGGTSSNGVANGIATTSGILTALGSLESTSNGVATLSGLLNSNLQGSVVVDTTTTTVAVLTGYGALETTITSTTTTTGLLNSELSAEGSINGQATTVGTLVAIGQLQGASNGVSTISATLLANGELNAVLNGLATTSGLLNSNLKGSAVSDTGSVVTGTMIAEGSLQVSTDGSTTTNALIIGIAAISCTVNCTSTTSGTLNANGTLIGVSTTATTLAGVLNALGQLQGIINGITTTEARAISDAAVGIITAQATTSAQIIGKGGLSAIIDGDTSTSATLIGLGVSEGTANGQATTAGTLSAKGTLSGAINAIASASGTLVSDAMLAVSNGQATINATLTQIISIEATSNGQATLQGQLVSDSLMFGSCLGLSDNSGQLTGLGNLESSISGLTTIDTTLNAKANLVVAISTSTTTEGILIATGNIEGQSNGVTTVQAITESNGLLNSVSNGQTTISGSLISTGLLVSDSNGVSTTSASLTAIGALVGNINSATTITTTLLAISSISGSIDGSASTSGILVSDALAGITNGTATTQSILTAYGSLAGAIEGTSDNELNPRVERTIEIQGSFEAKATTQGRLRVYDTNIDTTLFYEVVYLDRKYTVVYRKILHQVLYKNIIYYVRYKLTKRK